jgi:Cu+-exporting ATPase
VLLKGAATLEAVARLRQVVFDKTGTVTTGDFRLTHLTPESPWSADHLLALVASLEQGSEHPLGGAVIRAARERGLELEAPTGARAEPGRGITGRVGGRRVLVGNRPLIEEETGPLTAADSVPEGHTALYCAVDGQYAGMLALRDTVKPEAQAALRALHEMGLSVALLTGDTAEAARLVSAELPFERVEAGVDPRQKADRVRRLRETGGAIAMVGDGINDAPALAAADVGIALDTGTDVARAAADITLLGGDLDLVVRALRLSRATMRVIRQNLAWAAGYNVVLIPLAAFGVLNPIWAAAAMALSSVSVVTNSLRLWRAAI